MSNSYFDTIPAHAHPAHPAVMARIVEDLDLLEELSRHPHPGARRAVACNEATDRRIMRRLADDAHDDVWPAACFALDW